MVECGFDYITNNYLEYINTRKNDADKVFLKLKNDKIEVPTSLPQSGPQSDFKLCNECQVTILESYVTMDKLIEVGCDSP